jgi:predicted acylesterase/phospholipase RssA
MRPFRQHVAVAIDGGGIKGLICTKALSILEDALGSPAHQIFRLVAGTSTGSIISAGIAAGFTASELTEYYINLGQQVFPRTARSIFFPLSRYRYSAEPLQRLLEERFGSLTMGDFWSTDPPTDLVITTFDLVDNRTRFIKPWKVEYAGWPVVQAVLSSSTVPTYFPVVAGRYVDGGVGSYANPCYLAAYEASICLGWDPAETTLLSLGTGRDPHAWSTGRANKLWAWQWLSPIFGAFLQSADDQQVHLVNTFFDKLDFRRFQIDLDRPITMDDPASIPELVIYGEKMGSMILNDISDRAQAVTPRRLVSV